MLSLGFYTWLKSLNISGAKNQFLKKYACSTNNCALKQKKKKKICTLMFTYVRIMAGLESCISIIFAQIQYLSVHMLIKIDK